MDQEVLGELVRMKVPAVWQVMNQHDAMWTLVVSRWFICLYIDILPVEVRMKSKVVFCEKSSVVSFAVIEFIQFWNLYEIISRFYVA